MNIEKNATVVDVRTPGEFAERHFPGAINIPVNETARRLSEFKKMQKPIILYCAGGNRSALAAATLKQHGINEVQNAGGINDIFSAAIKSANNKF
jgi:phage shock protein E